MIIANTLLNAAFNSGLSISLDSVNGIGIQRNLSNRMAIIQVLICIAFMDMSHDNPAYSLGVNEQE